MPFPHLTISRAPRRTLAALALAAVGALTLAACSGEQDPTETTTPPVEWDRPSVSIDDVPAIASITWQQAQAVPDFDHAEYTTDVPEDIEALRGVLAEYGVTESWRYQHADCPGGLTTWVTADTPTGTPIEIQANSCDGASPFDEAIGDLVTEWREAMPS